MKSAPVLALPNFSLPFFLESDASDSGVGAVLCQQAYPIVFISQKLSHRMQKASTYHREMFVITQAVKNGDIIYWDTSFSSLPIKKVFVS